jgi:hypothetical protein
MIRCADNFDIQYLMFDIPTASGQVRRTPSARAGMMNAKCRMLKYGGTQEEWEYEVNQCSPGSGTAWLSEVRVHGTTSNIRMDISTSYGAPITQRALLLRA